jgi:multidrug efflux pump subunit AcrA (membrane-fusion protein)
VIAQINEALMYPSSPFSGVVERIYVKEGQAINPGTPIAQISGDAQGLKAIAYLSREMAQSISQADPSNIILGKEVYTAVPFFVSTDATDGNLIIKFRMENLSQLKYQ